MSELLKSGEKQLALAEQLLAECNAREAFAIYKAIALDSSYSASLRAHAYAGMGEIIECWEPSLVLGDDKSGLLHYHHALLLDENNFHALYGIIRSFGDTFPFHQDVILFEKAYKRLIGDKILLASYADLRSMLEDRYAALHRVYIAMDWYWNPEELSP